MCSCSYSHSPPPAATTRLRGGDPFQRPTQMTHSLAVIESERGSEYAAKHAQSRSRDTGKRDAFRTASGRVTHRVALRRQEAGKGSYPHVPTDAAQRHFGTVQKTPTNSQKFNEPHHKFTKFHLKFKTFVRNFQIFNKIRHKFHKDRNNFTKNSNLNS